MFLWRKQYDSLAAHKDEMRRVGHDLGERIDLRKRDGVFYASVSLQFTPV